MFEHYRQPLISRKAFLKRMVFCCFISASLFTVTVSAGTLVYHFVGEVSWVDGVLNSITIMTGQGIYLAFKSSGLKLFTSLYAVISTIVFFVILVTLFSPLAHRFLHRFHMEVDKENR